jgi:hypothetical protein
MANPRGVGRPARRAIKSTLTFVSGKVTIAHMPLKLADIVTAARLKRWTAAYALKHPESLWGMPKAGSQGVHRLFNPKQALRLAVFTLVLDHGFDLVGAKKVTTFVEKRIESIETAFRERHHNYKGNRNSPRCLWIYDGSFMSVDCENLRDTPEQWWHLIDGGSPVAPPSRPLTKTEINLSELTRLIGTIGQ